MRGKKILAVLMTATMVMAMSMTAFADGEPTNNGASEGSGTSEGHVDQKATNVVLPTIASGSTPFAYTMDPEGLVVTTSHEKYGEDVVFPSANDTHVYFNNGKDTNDKTQYLNSSAAQTVKNKSSHAIALTVTAEAVASEGGKDIPLAEKDDLEDATAAALYLGLVVGTDDAVAITDTAATKTVTLNGTAANFKIAVKNDKSGYEYRVLTEEEWLAANTGKTSDDFEKSWASTDFSVEGATTEDLAIASDTTAPKLKVTWSWVDPTAGPSITTKTATAKDGVDTEILFVGEAADISDIKLNGTTTSVKAKTTITGGKITVLSSWSDAWTSGMKRSFTVEFADGTTDSFEITKE